MSIKEAWARSVNNEEYKPYKHPIYGNKIRGKVRGVHYLIYNILRDLPRERGFEPLGEGYKEAVHELEGCIRSYDFNHTSARFEALLLPFEKEVTATELREKLK